MNQYKRQEVSDESIALTQFEIRKAGDRGLGDYGWLKSWHTFSFDQYHDPDQIGFSDLIVLNDDYLRAGAGFDTHRHENMEIFSYVLTGALEHKDSMGTGSVMRPGDVQLMSAGTGVLHSEFNPSTTEPVHFLQIWIAPNRTGLEPGYRKAYFNAAEKRGKLRLIISSDGKSGSLKLHQDAKVLVGLLDGDEQFLYEIDRGRYIYVHIVRGELTLNDEVLKEGDGVRVRGGTSLKFSRGKEAEVLIFDLVGKELPTSDVF